MAQMTDVERMKLRYELAAEAKEVLQNVMEGVEWPGLDDAAYYDHDENPWSPTDYIDASDKAVAAMESRFK